MPRATTRRALFVVFQFPPFAGSSAVQRALRFVQHLPAHGWEPLILTAEPRAYDQVAPDLLSEIPEGVHVERAFALDTKRQLSFCGRYPAFLANPDRWRTWQWGGRIAGARLIERYQPSVIWSTYPIVSAHEIGMNLACRFGLPWIADFRDPMVEDGFPEDERTRADFARRELSYSRTASAFSVTTPGMRDWFRARYPHLGADNVVLIENGYDESSFSRLAPVLGPLAPGAVTLLHSGELYPVIRDPVSLFAAARILVDRGVIHSEALRFRFRGAGDDLIVTRAARQHALENSVEALPRVPYAVALHEMMSADGLVILQGADCNRQIPAKVYEYLRSGRPVLGITDPTGDSGRTLLAAGCRYVAPLDDVGAIVRVLGQFLSDLRSGTPALPDVETVASASRESRAAQLAQLLDRATSGVLRA